jgi:3-oxoacyl-(acyl-carrier-protein) synthase
MRRVVVTGLGVVSPIGVGTETFWRALLRGEVGTGEIRRLDTEGCACRNGGEIAEFDPSPYVRRIDSRDLPRAAQFAVAAGCMALTEAGLLDGRVDRTAIGVCFGTVLANRPALEPYIVSGGDARVPSPLASTSMSRAAAAEFGLGGPALVIATACAAGNSAIGLAMDAIRAGRGDVMLAGGADELSVAMLRMFNVFRALSPDVVRPFDRQRKGLLLAEGAAALVLEELDHAVARGARVLAEVAGHANFADAHDMTAPHPEGAGAVRSMEAALAASGRSAADIDYISAHGTGTPLNDVVEARAIRRVFGADVDRVPVSSIKAMIGHAQGAASAIEAVSCVLAIRDGVLPPQVNVSDPDPACALNLVAGGAPRRPVRAALNNAFGFGGNVSCVVMTEPPDVRRAA